MRSFRHVVAAGLVVSVQAHAQDLSARIAAAKAAATTTEGAAYDKALGPFIGKAMRVCIPAGTTDPANLGSFTLVADVDPAGQVRNAIADPPSAVATCFQARFVLSDLPPPPAQDASFYPVVIEMKVVP